MYKCCCPARNSKNVGKTDRGFGARVQEHSGSDKKSHRFTIICSTVNILITW